MLKLFSLKVRPLKLSKRLQYGVGKRHHLGKIIFAAGAILVAGAWWSTSGAVDSPSSEVLSPSSYENLQPYQVRAGDTIFKLAKNYRITWQELVKLNSLTSPFILIPGQTLKLPELQEISKN